MSRKNPVANRAAGYFQPTTSGVPELTDQQDIQTANQPTVEVSAPPKEERIKRTFYLGRDDVALLRRLQTDQLEQTGKQPELSTLVSQAIQLLGQSRQQEG